MKPTRGCWGLMAVATLAMGMVSTSVLRADGAGGTTRAERLSSVDGEVQVAQGGQMLADHAIANTPLFEGTEVSTGSDGRAEVQFEDGSVARIPPGSSLTLSVLRPDGDTEVVLNGGMGYFELQAGSAGKPMRVRFGPRVITASGFTVLRIRLDEGAPSVAVFSGNVHLDSSGGSGVDLHGGETIALTSANPADSSVAESIEPDSWDAWNADRDQAVTTAETASTEADKGLPQANNPAWGDLNANGTWYDTGGQGYMWSPYEASNPGWDPYGTGNWMYTPGYGYVWVSGEPWGYMPYQCGAWNYYDAFGWGWAPGGCQTWWGGGGGGEFAEGGWYYTIGNAPRWYRMPVRPGPPKPHNPHPVERVRVVAPVIPVNRRMPMEGMPLPPRDRETPVALGGTIASPLRPEPSRPAYGHQPAAPAYGSRTVTGAPPEYGMRPPSSRAPENGAGRGGWPAARPAERPVEPGRPAQPYSAPRPAPSPGGSRQSYGGGGGGRSAPAPAASHSSPPPAPAPSHPK